MGEVFEGSALTEHSISIQIGDDADSLYTVSWRNQCRRSRCCSLTINGCHWLRARSPVHDDSIEWLWFDNDREETVKYNKQCQAQVECSFQSNLELNFPRPNPFGHCLMPKLTQMLQQTNVSQNEYTIKFEHDTQGRIRKMEQIAL